MKINIHFNFKGENNNVKYIRIRNTPRGILYNS